MIGQHDRAELVLHVALIADQPLAVAGQRAQLGQQRRGHRQRPPVPVLMAQRVRQHERVEGIRLRGREPVSLPRPRRHFRRDAEQPVAMIPGAAPPAGPRPARSRCPRRALCRSLPAADPGRRRHGRSCPGKPAAPRIEDAELMPGIPPVQPNEHPLSRRRGDLRGIQHGHIPSGQVTGRPAGLEPHHGARSATPAGHYAARLRQEGQVCIRASKAHVCIGPPLMAR